jgi:thiamine-phosphate pyrophosphorylase
MKLIVISPTEQYKNELQVVKELLEMGLDKYHLRKPHFSISQMEEFINGIPQKFHHKITLHSFHQLKEKFNLGGIHFTKKHFQWSEGRMKMMSKLINVKEGQTVSTSFHSLKELSEKHYNSYSYIFLSPVFDSISKENYKASFDLDTLKTSLVDFKKSSNEGYKTDIIALGGVKKDNLNKVAELGFDGIALLGAIWTEKGAEYAVEAFREIKEHYNN